MLSLDAGIGVVLSLIYAAMGSWCEGDQLTVCFPGTGCCRVAVLPFGLCVCASADPHLIGC